jgi:hypothetical protein
MSRMIASLVVLVFASPASFAQDAVLGSWAGVGFQKMSDGKIEQWTIRMHIVSRDNATIDYPSLNCGGTLTYLRDVGDIREFRERLTYGADRCIDNGTVGLHAKLGKLIWYWSGEGTKDPETLATSVLERTNQ